jgi:hypothetical protein
MAPRVLASILFALQALLWGGGSILEARTAAESLTRYSHVEDTGNPGCPPLHSHLDCLICRAFSGGALGAQTPSLDVVACDITINEVVVDQLGSVSLLGPLGPRAPPRA